MSRLKDRYQKEVMPALKKEFGYTNVMAIPKIEKVVINMGLGEATQNAKLADVGADELGRITGQKAVVRRATKSIAQFKLRQGMPVGAMVTLRGERMYEFLDRLITIALPRVRDFRGVSPKGFDGRGNYTLGLRDQLLFPEIDYMKVDKARGHERVGGDDGEDRRRGAQAAPADGHAVPDELEQGIMMATTAKIAKEAKTLKYKIRLRNRCKLCGRPRAYMRKFDDVPPVLPQAGARRRRHRRDEEHLVNATPDANPKSQMSGVGSWNLEVERDSK